MSQPYRNVLGEDEKHDSKVTGADGPDSWNSDSENGVYDDRFVLPSSHGNSWERQKKKRDCGD